MKNEVKTEKHWYDLHLFGLKIHPGVGAGTGAIVSVLHLGIISAFGSILLLASMVALIAKLVNKNK